MTEHWELVMWGGLVYVGSFVISLLVIVGVVVALPPTYFLARHERQLWVDQHPLVRFLLHLVKNLLGLAVIAVGLLLSLPGVPGQGLLTILIGGLLLDFPGKRHWERRIVAAPRILHTINRLRGRFGKAPLILDDER